MVRKLMRRQRGFTLIELLIVVAIIGIIAALLIPNFLESLQKAKQKRTMADMRNGGTAMMSWLTDEVGAAAAGYDVDPATTWAAATAAKTEADIEEVLVPQYVQDWPKLDGWKYRFDSYLDTGNPLAAKIMAIHSGGRNSTNDGTWPPNSNVPGSNGAYDPTSYNHDILWAEGYFIYWPEKLIPVN